MKVFIITPCGKESEILESHHISLTDNLKKINCTFKVNYIIDQFTDLKTKKILNNLKDANVINNTKFKGLAGCYLRGYEEFMQSDFDFVLEMDIESHPPESIRHFIEMANNGYEIILGSRNLKQANNNSTLKRRLLSFCGSFLSKNFLNSPLTDSTSGYQMFSKNVIDSIELKSFVSTSYFFQTEMKMRTVNQPVIEIENLIQKFLFLKNSIIKFYDLIRTPKQNRKFKYIEVPFVYNNSNSSINYNKIYFSFIEFLIFYFLV